MAFNTALSGLRAANTDLSVIGHNIANASTTGFKASRAEFADVYATSILGGGSISVGSGALVADVTQQFNQGNISFTNNTLDLAISGNGFFIFNEGGATTYGRAGNLQLDNDGFLVSNQGKRLQGFQADDTGALGGVSSDLQIDVQTQPPRLTTGVEAQLNLDARETPIQFGNRSAEGALIGLAVAGGGNNYPSEVITTTAIDGAQETVTTVAGATAKATASLLTNTLSGVQAAASTTATLTNITSTPAFTLTLNGETVGGANATAASIANAINALTDTTLPGITAVEAGGQVTVTSEDGENLQFVVGGGATESLDVTGTSGGAVSLDGAVTTTSTVGGSITMAVDEDLVVASDGTDLFASTGNSAAGIGGNELAFTPSFDPSDPNTFNHATSLTVFDSLGVPHVLTQYFVKESDLDDTVTNNWRMYVQIDGEEVGDPNPNSLTAPGDATVANFKVVFNEDGSLNENTSDTLFISNWTPKDANGNPNGSLGPINAAAGGSTQLADPPDSSNFVISLDGTTQFGSAFAVNAIDQDGFATGRLAGLDIGTEGVIFARFTNGEAQALGQIALADFTNQQGLAPNGDTEWTETFESGGPIVGAPGTAALGAIQSGALEESTTELSEELVKLIIAQRNFQANAQTIQTADTVTQTIINIR